LKEKKVQVMTADRPVVIGIAGGSGSGKTSVTKSVCERIQDQTILVIEQDYYYKDQSHLSSEQRLQTNYDHPLAFDTDLLMKHVEKLLNVETQQVIILEGILILEDARLRDLMDIKVFVDTDADLRIIRRMLRDIKERERTLDSVVHQYLQDVRPAHLQFVEPTKRYADIIIPEGGENHVAIDVLAKKIEQVLYK